jgi:hypothetical protein
MRPDWGDGLPGIDSGAPSGAWGDGLPLANLTPPDYPNVTGATLFDEITLRVYFDQPMVNDAALTTPGGWVLTPDPGNAGATITLVTPGSVVDPTYVDLTLSNPLTIDPDGYEVEAPATAVSSNGLLDTRIARFSGWHASPDPRGIIETLSETMGRRLNGLTGFSITRASASAVAGAVSLDVESAIDWPESGSVSIQGVKYGYSSRTSTSLDGLTHTKYGVSIAGLAFDVPELEPVLDVSKNRSDMDLIRRGLFVETAESSDLDVVGRNIGVFRSAAFSLDSIYREQIKAQAYGPHGTIYGIEKILDALIGSGNYEIYEDLIAHPGEVFLSITNVTAAESRGKLWLGSKEYALTAGVTPYDVAITGEPTDIVRAKLADLAQQYDFRSSIPSAISHEHYPGAAPAAPFAYIGAQAEGSAVTASGSYTEFDGNSSAGSADYRQIDTNGARIAEDSKVTVEFSLNVRSGVVLSGSHARHFLITIHDGTYRIEFGVRSGPTAGEFYASFVDSLASPVTAVQFALDRDEWHTLKIVKQGTTASVWANGVLVIDSFDISISVATGFHRWEFGIPQATDGIFWTRDVAITVENTRDHCSSLRDGNTAAPNEFTPGTAYALKASPEQHFLCLTKDSPSDNGYGGNGVGVFEIVGDTGGTYTVQGVTRPREIRVVDDDKIQADHRVFRYPDDLGRSIVISGSSVGNDGSYRISKIFAPDGVTELSSSASGYAETSNLVEVVTTSDLALEDNLDLRIDPLFVAEAFTDAIITNTETLTTAGGKVTDIDFEDGSLWGTGLVMEVHGHGPLSGQLLVDQSIKNESDAYYPAYLFEETGTVKPFVEALTAAGIIVEEKPS